MSTDSYDGGAGPDGRDARPNGAAVGSSRAAARLTMGAGAILSVTAAASMLPVNDSTARAWLRRHQLVRDLEGKDIVLWRDVLAELSAGNGPEAVDATPAVVHMPRVRLDPLT